MDANPAPAHTVLQHKETPSTKSDDSSLMFPLLVVEAAMLDLAPFFKNKPYLAAITRMSLTRIPIANMNPWIREKLLQSSSASYWTSFFSSSI